jgi:hypothetical protein
MDAKKIRVDRARREMFANRQRGWLVSEEETCRAEGLSLTEFWDFILNNKKKASDFKRILYEGFLSPRGWDGPLLFDTILNKLLREALDVGEPWVSPPPEGKGGEHGELIVRQPREAIEWILERREDLIPPCLSGQIKPASSGPASGIAPKKSVSTMATTVLDFLLKLPHGTTREAALERCSDEIRDFYPEAFKKAWLQVPAEKKRGQGKHGPKKIPA